MTVTAGQLIAQAEHEIGGPVAVELGGGLALVNWSGRHLYDMRGWSSALRASRTAAYVAGQSYATLPADFGELEYVREGTLAFRVVSPAEVERMRAYGTEPRVGALVHDGTAWRLELVRTPTASDPDALSVVYRRRWVDLVSDQDQAPIPEWLESLLRRVVSAYARGLEAGTLDEELARVESSPVYAAAIQRDARGAGVRVAYTPGTGAADQPWPTNPYAWVRDTSIS